jgi:hypothetical protein
MAVVTAVSVAMLLEIVHHPRPATSAALIATMRTTTTATATMEPFLVCLPREVWLLHPAINEEEEEEEEAGWR